MIAKREDPRPNPGRYLGQDRGQFASILIFEADTEAEPALDDLSAVLDAPPGGIACSRSVFRGAQYRPD